MQHLDVLLVLKTRLSREANYMVWSYYCEDGEVALQKAKIRAERLNDNCGYAAYFVQTVGCAGDFDHLIGEPLNR